IPRLRGRPDVKINTVLATNFLRFNVTHKPLDDVRIRRALDLALDREALCRHIYRGGEEPARSLVPPSLPGYAPSEAAPGGLERARQLLAEAGYPGGGGFPELELLHAAQELSRAVAEAIAATLKERLGIRIRPAPQEFKVYIDSMSGLRYQIALGMWIGDYVDPSTFLDLFRSDSGGNRTGWKSPEYDRLLARASRAASAEVRMGVLREAEQLLLELGPIAPLCYRSQVNLLSQRVEGFSVNLLDLHPLDRLRLRER
ncbi:MAG: ABC transporter substrate-binding protein, partial [Planctomycetota bacterium]